MVQTHGGGGEAGWHCGGPSVCSAGGHSLLPSAQHLRPPVPQQGFESPRVPPPHPQERDGHAACYIQNRKDPVCVGWRWGGLSNRSAPNKPGGRRSCGGVWRAGRVFVLTLGVCVWLSQWQIAAQTPEHLLLLCQCRALWVLRSLLAFTQ